jgi:hypothetical protein
VHIKAIDEKQKMDKPLPEGLSPHGKKLEEHLKKALE